ncbi:MAG: hypothetical protein JSS97_03715 [Actinobacteria bacterium]|nr:hypothetical protein [Actinomycetota bacterium]
MGTELFDPDLCQFDDGVPGIVVLLQLQRLPAHRCFDLLSLRLQVIVLGLAGVGLLGGGRGNHVRSQETEAIRAEDALRHELTDRLEDHVLLDAEDLWVAHRISRRDAALVDVLAAVPVGALLVASLHAPTAEPAADLAAQDIEPPAVAVGATSVSPWMSLGGRDGVAAGFLLDGVERSRD